jgi:hypothetical protein
MSQAPFVVQARLTAMTMGYRNKDLIADKVARRVPVSASVFKWNSFSFDTFTSPVNDQVGRKGRVNEVDWAATELTAATEDHALQEAVPNLDKENADANRGISGVAIDPEATATVLVSDLIALNREVRVASMWSNPANYAAGNSVVLSGTAQWDQTTTSDPIAAITDAMDAMLVRPNKAVTSRKVLTSLLRHPKVVNAYFGSGQTNAGIAPVSFLAELLGLDEINVGTSFVNLAKKGQAPNLTRVWGNMFSLYVDNNLVGTPQDPGLTFGYTAQWGDRISGPIPDANIGMRGGVWVRVGEAVKELIVANMCGYLFTNVLSTG